MKQVYGDKVWENLFSTRDWGKYPPEEVIRFYMRAKSLINKKITEVLDIGCGIGACTWFIANEGSEVTAIDGSPSALMKLEETIDKFHTCKSRVHPILGDITYPKKFIKKNKTFDLLLDNYSLYANTYKKIINAYYYYYCLLKNDGFFLTNCFGLETTGFKTGKKLSSYTYKNVSEGLLQMKGIVTFWDRDILNHLFEDIGYKIVYTERILEERQGVKVEKLITCLSK